MIVRHRFVTRCIAPDGAESAVLTTVEDWGAAHTPSEEIPTRYVLTVQARANGKIIGPYIVSHCLAEPSDEQVWRAHAATVQQVRAGFQEHQ